MFITSVDDKCITTLIFGRLLHCRHT